MKKIFVGSIMPMLIWASTTDLRTIISHAEHNSLNQAKEINIRSKCMEEAAAQSAYAPTVDIGLSQMLNSPVTLQTPGSISSAFVNAKMNLFDGGRKALKIESKQYEVKAAEFERKAFAKSTALNVVKLYFTLKKIRANLSALYQRSKELKAQIERIRQLKKAGLATSSSVAKLKAAYEGNRYAIANTKLSIESTLENLRLLSGAHIGALKRNYILEPHGIHMRLFDSIQAMKMQAKSIGKSAASIRAAYMPQVNASYTYTKSAISELSPKVPPASVPDHSHKFQITAAMRLYDGGAIRGTSESIRYKKLALLSQISHQIREQKMNFKLASRRLHTTRTQIESSRSALHAAQSAYNEIKQKYEAGVVDNVTYLDALTQKTLSQARYQATRYDYEINKAVYYFYAGHNIKRYIR